MSCIGCIYDEMQLNMLKTLFTIVEYRKIFKQEPPINENQNLFTRRWIRAAQKGKDVLADFVGFRVVAPSGHVCGCQGTHNEMEISRLRQLGMQQLAALNQEGIELDPIPLQVEEMQIAEDPQPELMVPNYDDLFGPLCSLEAYSTQQCSYHDQEMDRLCLEACQDTSNWESLPNPSLPAPYEAPSTTMNTATTCTLDERELSELADLGQSWSQAGMPPNFPDDLVSLPLLDDLIWDEIRAASKELMEWMPSESNRQSLSPEEALYGGCLG